MDANRIGARGVKLSIGKDIHLNGLDRRGFPVHHAPNLFCGVAAEQRFAAVETDGGRNLLNPYRFAVDVEDLADQFLAAFGLPTHMTAKYGYLRLASSYHSMGNLALGSQLQPIRFLP